LVKPNSRLISRIAKTHLAVRQARLAVHAGRRAA
jgi:hypothetical protein